MVLSTGSGGSRAVEILSLTNFDLTGIKGAAHVLHKDVTTVLALAESLGAAQPGQLARLAQLTLASLDRDT